VVKAVRATLGAMSTDYLFGCLEATGVGPGQRCSTSAPEIG
jgi:hypothetical protein